MIHTIAPGESRSGLSPVRVHSVIDHVVRAKFSGALKLFIATRLDVIITFAPLI